MLGLGLEPSGLGLAPTGLGLGLSGSDYITATKANEIMLFQLTHTILMSSFRKICISCFSVPVIGRSPVSAPALYGYG